MAKKWLKKIDTTYFSIFYITYMYDNIFFIKTLYVSRYRLIYVT